MYYDRTRRWIGARICTYVDDLQLATDLVQLEDSLFLTASCGLTGRHRSMQWKYGCGRVCVQGKVYEVDELILNARVNEIEIPPLMSS